MQPQPQPLSDRVQAFTAQFNCEMELSPELFEICSRGWISDVFHNIIHYHADRPFSLDKGFMFAEIWLKHCAGYTEFKMIIDCRRVDSKALLAEIHNLLDIVVPIATKRQPREIDFANGVRGRRFGKKIELAPTDEIDKYETQMLQILEILGHSEALVTDESRVHDFTISKTETEKTEILAKLSELSKSNVKIQDYLFDIAKKIA